MAVDCAIFHPSWTAWLWAAVTGVGYAWSKFSAYASDWESCLPTHPGPPFACSWCLCEQLEHMAGRGPGILTATLCQRLCGVLDRHSLAASDLLGKLEAARRRISSKCCSWDEARAPWCILGGTLNYAFLVGLPAPSALHREDAALHRLIHASLGTRVTAEHAAWHSP